MLKMMVWYKKSQKILGVWYLKSPCIGLNHRCDISHAIHAECDWVWHKKRGVIFYQQKIIGCDILNVHLLKWDIIQAQNTKVWYFKCKILLSVI